MPRRTRRGLQPGYSVFFGMGRRRDVDDIDIFQSVRERVSARAAAEFYGVHIYPNGRALCCFHDDHRPSMSFHAGRFRCFSCGAHGSSIDFVSLLYGLDALDAVRKLNDDFRLGLSAGGSQSAQERQRARLEAEHRQQVQNARELFEAWKQETINLLSAAFREGHTATLKLEAEGMDAITAAEGLAIGRMEWANDKLDTLTNGDLDEQMKIFRERGEVKQICNQILNGLLRKSQTA